LIVPQLGAPGIAAHEVKKMTGFRVIYGPVEAGDLPKFLDSGFKATPEMRRKSFSLAERTVLIPVELVDALKTAMILIPAFVLLSGFGGPGSYMDNLRDYGFFAALSLLTGLISGAVLVPILLPWIPGRAFAVKGLVVGLISSVVLLMYRTPDFHTTAGILEAVSWTLIVTSLSMYLGMNFTGASTYTSLSGVRKEMKWAFPVEMAAAIIGSILWLFSRLIA
jgi:acetyl-CoA decarbonylase/synthase complex subunit gamma